MIVRKKIKAIEFGLFSPAMIKKLSAVKIFTSNTYDEDGYPIEGGLMDPRLGVIDPGIRCKTCGGRLGECQGHFGHIELTRPVIHVGYAKEIYKLLKITCRSCSRILLSEDKIKKLNSIDEIIENAAKVNESQGKCPYCNEQQIKIKFVRPYSYYEGETSLLPTDIRERFEKITEDDLKLLGVKIRPEWMILSVLPVLPIIVRPSITLESADRSEDDLTHKLVDILRINQRLEENINSGAPQLIVEDLWDLLQYHVATYFDNGIIGIPPARHRSGRPLKTITQRLKGKEGRFRNNLSGKRVNFSARTVVSPDPEISINEVVVPKVIATELTIPEEVNERNIKKLRELILNGPNAHPGAKNVIVEYGRKRVMESNKKEIAASLKEGDIVERTIKDGDLVIFNRQPSLHRISMMCHQVKVLPYNTFRLNTAVCAPYNADFDGDEMNLHVPQTEEARAEAEILMKVQECILSPRYGRPIIGGRHDHVTGTYLLTKKDSKFDRKTALNLVKDLAELPKDKKTFTGKEIFSLLLPKDFSVKYKAKLCKKCETCKKEKCEDEAYVVINNGTLTSGVIDSQGMAGTLVNELFLRYGSDITREFIDKSTKLAIRVVMLHGFTIGIDEEDLPTKEINEISKVISKSDEIVNSLIKEFNEGKLKPIPGKSSEESLEDYIMAELSKARNDAGKIAEKFAKDNFLAVMAKIGARGSLLNLTQMSACVGQQAVRGKRIKRGYFARTLSHFKKGDVSASANGFVSSNFKNGLSMKEYFFHAMGGRESLVDTAIRTGRSGYMQRRLINALQDLRVYPDLSVRGTPGIIVQFKYGEDGVDPSKKGYLKYKEENYIKKALVVPGEAVGTVAAQSIGEPGTQMTLRTFHYAGVAELAVPLGLPRLIEIIDAKRSPNNPMMTIYLDEKNRKSREFAESLANKLQEIFLKDVSKVEVSIEKKEIIVETDNEEAKAILEKISENSSKNKFVIRKKSLIELKKLMNKLEKKRLSGVKGIKRVFVREQNGEFVIYTEGSNLKAILSLEGVDKERTTTNDIQQIYEVLGIEAARNAIINEAMKVLEEQRLDVDIRHIMLVADRMCVTGELQAVGRTGISGSKESVLARAAFEETEKHILNAALYGEVDTLSGVAENIIIGQPIPIGTGTVELEVKKTQEKKNESKE
ncbi:MAG: DNA-directed RNA polymerase subunit A' [Candidatus Altiarchaeota archaeon]